MSRRRPALTYRTGRSLHGRTTVPKRGTDGPSDFATAAAIFSFSPRGIFFFLLCFFFFVRDRSTRCAARRLARASPSSAAHGNEFAHDQRRDYRAERLRYYYAITGGTLRDHRGRDFVIIFYYAGRGCGSESTPRRDRPIVIELSLELRRVEQLAVFQ